MAGTIELGPEVRWSAATWLFRWVLETASAMVDDDSLRSRLVEITHENLGWLSLPDLPPVQEETLRIVFRDGIVERARETLPDDMDGREVVIGHPITLAELVVP